MTDRDIHEFLTGWGRRMIADLGKYDHRRIMRRKIRRCYR